MNKKLSLLGAHLYSYKYHGKMYSLFNNYTVSPSALANVSNMMYNKMESALVDPSNPSHVIICIVIFLISAMYTFLSFEMTKQMELLRDINKNNTDNFEILRDILQENGADICAVREDVRSIRKNVSRLSKSKIDSAAAEALVVMKND